MAVAFADHGRVLIDVLESAADKPVDIQAIFARFTFDSFCEVAYGRSFDSLLDENNAFTRAFNEAQALTANRILFPIYKVFGPLAFLLPSERRLKAAMCVLHDTTTEIVGAFRSAAKEGDVSEKARSSLLARFVDDRLSDEEIRESVLNFLLAGRDTTATTLTFAIYFIFQMPKVVEKLRAEIAEISDEVTFENHTRFKYFLAVMDETMRLAPPVPLDVKFAAETHTLPSGIVIPKVGDFFFFFPSSFSYV
jgi:cytochrome P450